MKVQAGDTVKATFPGGTVDAVVIEVKGGEVLVREAGTMRSEWVPLHRIA